MTGRNTVQALALTRKVNGRATMARMSIFKELWEFMKVRKKFWLLPIIITLLLFGILIVLTSGSAIAPFIYTLF